MPHFTAEGRQASLDVLLTAFENDFRLTGVIVVGSAAAGFDDRFSDIDLAVVVDADYLVSVVFKDWQLRVNSLLPVATSFEVQYADHSFLAVFMLENYLEIDIGFLRLDDLVAKRERWQLAFDRSGQIESIMRVSWENRPAIDLEQEYSRRLWSIWHYITLVEMSISRGHPCRAIHYLEIIRTRSFEITCLGLGHDPRHFKPVHLLPEPFLHRLPATLPTSTDDQELYRALRQATDLFFDACNEIDKSLGTDSSGDLRSSMHNYLDLMSLG